MTPRRSVGIVIAIGSLVSGMLVATADARSKAIMRSRGPTLVTFDVRDAATGKHIPGKLTFEGVGATATPKFSKRQRGDRQGPSVVAWNRVFTATGTGTVRVPRGTYDVHVSRGPEWTKHVQRVVVTGEAMPLKATLSHVVDTRGWISADFHVHSTWSSDSSVPLRSRTLQAMSDGLDVVVSTEHNVVSDYTQTIADLGAGAIIGSARGMELTTGRWGHFGVFPIPAKYAFKKRGAVLARGNTAGDFFRLVRSAEPEAIVIVNHPMARSSSYFALGKLDARTGKTRRGFSWDFDALEVANGHHHANFRDVDRIMKVWFQLLDLGRMVAIVGNSDTHAMHAVSRGQAGYPRNYVAVPNDRPDKATPLDIARGVRARRVVVSTGPFVRMTVGKAGIGDIAPAPGGKATLHVEVQAAPWVSVSEVMVYIGGTVAMRFDVDKSSNLVRFEKRIPIRFSRDTHAVVRVRGNDNLYPVAGGRGRPIPSLAITNPIFFDVDGNGRFDGPKAAKPERTRKPKPKRKPRPKPRVR